MLTYNPILASKTTSILSSKRPTIQFQANVIFGRTDKGCSGQGICTISMRSSIEILQENQEKGCSKVNVFPAQIIRSSESIQIAFKKADLCACVIRNQFANLQFQQKSLVSFDDSTQKALKCHSFSIPTGVIPVIEDEWTYKIQWKTN